MNYTQWLRFDETPNYAILREIFRGCFERKGYTGTLFDWQEVPETTLASSPPTADDCHEGLGKQTVRVRAPEDKAVEKHETSNMAESVREKYGFGML